MSLGLADIWGEEGPYDEDEDEDEFQTDPETTREALGKALNRTGMREGDKEQLTEEIEELISKMILDKMDPISSRLLLTAINEIPFVKRIKDNIDIGDFLS